MKYIFVLLISTVYTFQAFGQFSDSNLYARFDISPRWIWRGASYSDVPVLQPSLGYSGKKLNVMIWSSYPVNNTGYAELDFVIEYYIHKQLKVGFTDYFAIPDNRKFDQKFFDFKNATTAHLFDIFTEVKPLKNIPLQLYCSWWFYGMDKDTASLKQHHSIYIEAQYSKKVGNYVLHSLCGATPYKSFYYSDAAIVNVGIGISRSISIKENFSIPLKTEFILNPATENVFFNATVGLKL